jgi:hypothetical protein
MSDAAPNRHADWPWVTAAFLLFLVFGVALLIKSNSLTPGIGGVLWAVCSSGLLFSSIRLCVIVIEAIQATYFPPAAVGACPRCGYDLRGLRGTWRCPECGELFIEEARETSRGSRR